MAAQKGWSLHNDVDWSWLPLWLDSHRRCQPCKYVGNSKRCGSNSAENLPNIVRRDCSGYLISGERDGRFDYFTAMIARSLRLFIRSCRSRMPIEGFDGDATSFQPGDPLDPEP